MTELERIVLERIERDGPMPFAAYMSLALYHPRCGYYTAAAERTGWRGHYLTSPELDPAFGELWARGLGEVWDACGRPDRFEVVEIGPGEGSFAAAALNAMRGDLGRALTYRLVERSPSLQERQRERLDDERVEWTPSIVEIPRAPFGCVFANEVLDNLPVHVVEAHNGRILEVCVDAREGRLVESLRPPSNPELVAFLSRTGVELPDGHRHEVALAAESFVRRAASALGRGALIVVDYGARAAELATRPGGTLLCYSDAGVDGDPLDRPGEKDITCHANWTAVGLALEANGLLVAGPLQQRSALVGLGAAELDDRLKDDHSAALREGRGADAVAALSRRNALGALLDPSGLGGLEVIAGFRGIEAPAFLS